ncbi:MAG: hypothetical protein ACU4F9_02955 [Arcticibacter sp.]
MKIIENEIMKGLLDKPKPSEETFKVPEGFFDDFLEQILSGEGRRVIKNPRLRLYRISIAAVFTVLALSAALIYQQSEKNDLNNELSAEDLAHYIVLEGTSHEELAQQIITEPLDDLSDESQSDDIYETYLLEQEIDINHLNEEL